MFTEIKNLSAADIIAIGDQLKTKNLSLTPVKLKVHDDHIVVTDKDNVVLTFTKTQRILKATG